MIEKKDPGSATVILTNSVVHTITYFFVGLLAFTIFDYTSGFAEGGLRFIMRPTEDPLLMAGPKFKPIQGVLFGIVLWLIRDSVIR